MRPAKLVDGFGFILPCLERDPGHQLHVLTSVIHIICRRGAAYSDKLRSAIICRSVANDSADASMAQQLKMELSRRPDLTPGEL